MASLACPTRTARRPSAPGSGATRSASSTSTSPRSTPSRAASICSSPSAVSRRLIRSPKDRQQRCRWPAGPGGDRTSKFAFVQLHERATRRAAADFLHALVAAVPYRIHTMLTDNGTQFVDRTPTNEAAEAAAEAYWAAKGEPRIWLVHAFDHACDHACEQPCSGLAAAPSGDRCAMASTTAPPSRHTPSAGSCLRSLQEADRWPARPVLLNRTALLMDDRPTGRSWPSMDQWAGGADEPNAQGRHRPSLPLRQP